MVACHEAQSQGLYGAAPLVISISIKIPEKKIGNV